MELSFSWPAASLASGLVMLAAGLSYVPGCIAYAVAAGQSALLLAPLSVRYGESREALLASCLYASLWAALSLAGSVSPLVALPALWLFLSAASKLSYRVGAAVHRTLNLLLTLPPGRFAAKKSKFGEAYASNALAISSVASIALLLWTRLLLLGMAAAVLLVMSVYMAALRDDGARSFESELPFLMMLSSFYSSAGHRGIEAALESISSAPAKVFKGLGLARLTFLHERLYSGPTPARALERFATRQKDKTLAQIVDGYRTVSATGGDTYAYLAEQTDRSLTHFEEARLDRVRTTRGIAEVLLLTLALAPSVALTISVIGLNGSETLYLLASALPVASLLALTLVDLYLPPVRDEAGIGWGLSFGLAAGAVVLVLTKPFSSTALSLTAASVALLLPLSVQYQLETNAARRDERDSLKMITSLVEALRIGKSVHEALADVSEQGSTSPFMAHVREFTTQIGLGVPPPEAGARIESRSWVTKASFVIIGYTMVLGGGLGIVERFRSFLTKYVDSWEAVRREALWTAALSASLPFVTLGGVSVITSLQGSIGAASQQPALAVTLQVIPLQSVLLAFVEVSALAAVLSSKLAGFTIKATPVALATMAATLISLLAYGLA